MVEFTPEKSKKIALARLDIVHQWLDFRKKSTNKLQADYDFVNLHNTSNSHLFDILGKISRGTLHRWKNILNGTEDALSKLNIIYDWTPAKNGLEWNGVGAKYTYKIEITNCPRLKKWGVVVKKNNRKFENLLCSTEQEAFDKMFEFIRGTYNEQ